MARAAMKIVKTTLTHVQIRNALPVLKGLQKQPMGARASLIIARQGRTLSGHAMDSEETRLSLMRKYANKDEDGEPITIPVLDGDGNPIPGRSEYEIEDKEPLNTEWTEVMMQEVDVQIPLLPLEDLDKSNIELTPEEMSAIEPLLSE